MPDQRPYNVNILVGCAGPDTGDTIETRYGSMRSRGSSMLKHTMSDVELIDRYWSDCGGSSRNVENLVVEDPTLDELKNTIDEAHFLLRKYPTSMSGIDFYFAGHGLPNGSLVLRDGNLHADDFLDMLSGYESPDDGTLGFGFMLDCCYSGGFLFNTIAALEQDKQFRRKKLRMYDAFVSSMFNEVSRESNWLGHGIFTFAFAVQTNVGVDVKRVKEIVESVPNHKGLREVLTEDISAMEFRPFAPAAMQLTPFLTAGTQNPIDCINGHALVAEKGEIDIADWDEPADVRSLVDAFLSAMSPSW